MELRFRYIFDLNDGTSIGIHQFQGAHGSYWMKITGTTSVVIQKSNLGMAVSATKPADEPAACWIGWVLAFLCSCLVWDCYLSISTKLERPFYTICLHLYSVWGSSFPRVWFDSEGLEMSFTSLCPSREVYLLVAFHVTACHTGDLSESTHHPFRQHDLAITCIST